MNYYPLHNLLGFLLLSSTTAFSPPVLKTKRVSPLFIYAPPGSGYARPEDEESTFPDTYDPMLEYPGTMRPGRTPENMPYQDLPIGDDDPDPVPWPHFQQIEWHHKWDPPHPHPIPMEEFIELHGRWATPEMEAKMRAGVRRGVRERQEKEATERNDMIITDDDEDEGADEEPVDLGEAMVGVIGSAADFAITAEKTRAKEEGEEEEEEEEVATATESEDDDLDSFLLDLGLDADVEDMVGGGGDEEEATATKKTPTAEKDDADSPQLNMVSGSGDIMATINVEDEDELDIGLDEDDDVGGGDGAVPLEDLGDDNDILAGEDIFDEGGFDFDSGDFDDGDVW